VALKKSVRKNADPAGYLCQIPVWYLTEVQSISIHTY